VNLLEELVEQVEPTVDIAHDISAAPRGACWLIQMPTSEHEHPALNACFSQAFPEANRRAMKLCRAQALSS
jgi:hypothetical protein